MQLLAPLTKLFALKHQQVTHLLNELNLQHSKPVFSPTTSRQSLHFGKPGKLAQTRSWRIEKEKDKLHRTFTRALLKTFLEAQNEHLWLCSKRTCKKNCSEFGESVSPASKERTTYLIYFKAILFFIKQSQLCNLKLPVNHSLTQRLSCPYLPPFTWFYDYQTNRRTSLPFHYARNGKN